MIAILIIAAVLFIAFIVLIVKGIKKMENTNKLCLQELEQKGIHFDLLTKVQSGYIGMDKKARKLIFTKTNLLKPIYEIFAFEDIYSCELLKNNEIVARKSTIRTITGAIIGEAIGGQGGMIVGSLSGNSHSKAITNLIELKLVVKDIESPTHKIIIYNNDKDNYEQLSSEAEKWNARINLIIEQIDLEYASQKGEAETTPNDGNQSLADELAKLHELKQKGILTEEEFNAQKKKLLGL